jgi:hypothetical protein
VTTAIKLFTPEELDALRDVLDAGGAFAYRDIGKLLTGYAFLLGIAKGMEQQRELHAVYAEENSKLRAQAIAISEVLGEAGVVGGTLFDGVQQLIREAEEDDALRSRLTSLLTRTANALKGEPAPLAAHDWSDLPDVAARAIEALRLLGAEFQWRTKSVAKRIEAQRGDK